MSKKNIGIIFGVVIGIVLIVICFFISPADNSTDELYEDSSAILENAQAESAAVKDEEKKEFTNINVTQYLEYYNGEEKQLVLLARPTCQYCQIAEPIIQNVAFQYDIIIHYLNSDDFTDEDTSNLYYSDEYFKEGYGTPVLLLVGNKEIIDKVDGLTDYTHYVEFFKKNGYIE